MLPSTTYRASAFIDAASALGVEVIVGSDASFSPIGRGGPAGARDQPDPATVALDLDDLDAAVAAAIACDATRPIDAVVGVDDRSVMAAASIAESLGIAHNPLSAVAATRDKLTMRRLLGAAEVPQPEFAPLERSGGPDAWRAAARAVGYPCVLKPRTLSASQGVVRVDAEHELAPIADRVWRICDEAGETSGALVVERFVPGAEMVLEGMLTAGRLEVLAHLDKPDPMDGPYFPETIFVMPSRQPEEALAASEAAVQKACTALGLAEGPIHAEVRIDASRAWVVEIAARTIGGLCGRTLALATGATLEEVVLSHAAGLPPPRRHAAAAAGVAMLPVAHGGTFLGISGREQALAMPGVVGLEITLPVGATVLPAPEGNRYLGFLFAKGLSPEHVERTLRAAQDCLEIHIAAES